MRTCTRHAGAVVVYMDSRDSDCPTFCPVCKMYRRQENTNAEIFNELDALRQKLREAENTAGAMYDGRGLENRIRALKMEIAVLHKELREAKGDIDSHCQCSKCVLLRGIDSLSDLFRTSMVCCQEKAK